MLGTGHFGLVVSNLDRSLTFYHDILEFELICITERTGEDISRLVGMPETYLQGQLGGLLPGPRWDRSGAIPAHGSCFVLGVGMRAVK